MSQVRASPTYGPAAAVDKMGLIQEHNVLTEVPGPLSKAMVKKLDAVFDARAVHFVADYEASEGN